MKTLTTRRRPLLQATVVALAGSLALAGCGQAENIDDANPGATDESEAPEGEATIRFAWWGSDSRHQMNQELIDAFMAEHPDITVVPDFTDWGGYWDKLATQTAGGDTPDVLMQEERYLREYADRGVLANLAEYDIDTSQIEDSILGSGEFDDGLWGIPTGVNVRAYLANPQVFADAGVEMPDDTAWTWDDYAEVTAGISANGGDGVYGTQEYGFIEPDLSIWARQHGQSLWTADGEIGFTAELMAERWQMSLDLVDAAAAPPATESLELEAGGPEQSLVATNRGGLSMYWSNQLEAISGASGQELQLLRYPGETEFERTGLFLKPAMALSMYADSEYPEAAATFIDWMLNSPDAGAIILTDRGLPANGAVRESIADQLSPAEQQAADFVAAVGEDVVDAPAPPPVGAGEVAALLSRLNEQVMFGQMDPMTAAEQFITEATAITGG